MKSSIKNQTQDHHGLWSLNEIITQYQESKSLPPILSPTLPSIFETKVRISKKHNEQSDSERIRRDESNEEIPLSMLSPTLPAMFNESRSSSAPPSSNSFTNKKTKVGTFKWINKINDPSKPKFLMRINFNDRSKFKNCFGSSLKNNDTKDLRNGDINEIRILKDQIKNHELENQRIAEENQNLNKDFVKLQKEFEQAQRSIDELKVSLEKDKTKLKPTEVEAKKGKPPSEDEQKRRHQLKQLTQDIIFRESSQPPVEEKITLESFQDESMVQDLTNQQRGDLKIKLIDSKNHYLQLSKTMTTRLQSLSDEFLKIIIQMDTILVKIVAFDYDERSKIVSQVLPSERSWKTLDSEISELIKKIHTILPSFSNIKYDFLKISACILYQARGIVIKRVNNILSIVIQSYISKRSDNLDSKIIELQQQLISNHKLIIEHFMNSKPSYLTSIIPIKFSYTWYNKCLSLIKCQQDYNLNNYQQNLKPPQLYYLPFGDYTNLNEFNGFVFNVLKEFIEIYNKINPNQPIKYTLQSNT